MCKICGRMICPGSCPNADEPEAEYKCSLCGAPIYEGDLAFKFEGDHILCENCIDDARTII